MLPFDIEDGKDYIDWGGNRIRGLALHKAAGCYVGFVESFSDVLRYSVRGEGVGHDGDIIMPADTWGVYHVSDGDTPLKAALERWITSGGKAEVKYTYKPQWVTASGSYINSHDDSMMYRAAGCTEDREFPQPKPKMPDRVWGGACTDAGLLAELKAWKDAGGGIECKHSFIRDEWEPIDTVLWREECLYRALGCTAEPVIDPPQPPAPKPDWRSKPVTCGDMYDNHAKYGSIDEANWWQQRAQQDSRP